jgi:hypothetical protein
MLSYDKNDLIVNKGFSTDVDVAEAMNYSKDGYDCFYKKIVYTPEDDKGNVIKKPFISDGIDTRDFWYKVK